MLIMPTSHDAASSELCFGVKYRTIGSTKEHCRLHGMCLSVCLCHINSHNSLNSCVYISVNRMTRNGATDPSALPDNNTPKRSQNNGENNKKALRLVGQCETPRLSSHSDCRLKYLISLVSKTFVRYRASSRIGELTATTTRHQPFM